MKLKILFWFYKEPAVCLNRLRLIRRYNPGLEIFGLFGGPLVAAPVFQKKLKHYLTDFYISPYCRKNSRWKWLHGDLMIWEWFLSRGRNLRWDSLAVLQWDVLVHGSLLAQLPGLRPGQLYLSGLRKLDKSLEQHWYWTRASGGQRPEYLLFKKYLKKHHHHAKDIWACLFILQVFPRKFLEKYSRVEDRGPGFLEYQIPTYAKLWRVPCYVKDPSIWWPAAGLRKRPAALTAEVAAVPKEFILAELKKKAGARIFHPYNQVWTEK